MTTFENKKKLVEKLITLNKPGEKIGKLASDLNYPHAYVFGCIFNRQVKAERAWKALDKLKSRIEEESGIEGFHFQTLKELSKDTWEKICKNPTPIHRFPKDMSVCLYEAVKLIAEKYDGDASKIWKGNPSSGEIICRFLEFRGVGQKISAMATRILKEMGIPMSDDNTIDVAADVHITKVFYRLGFISKDDKAMAISAARKLYLDFPAVLDYPTWYIGSNWCKPKKPVCKNCEMNEICPKIGVNKSAD